MIQILLELSHKPWIGLVFHPEYYQSSELFSNSNTRLSYLPKFDLDQKFSFSINLNGQEKLRTFSKHEWKEKYIFSKRIFIDEFVSTIFFNISFSYRCLRVLVKKIWQTINGRIVVSNDPGDY